MLICADIEDMTNINTDISNFVIGDHLQFGKMLVAIFRAI